MATRQVGMRDLCANSQPTGRGFRPAGGKTRRSNLPRDGYASQASVALLLVCQAVTAIRTGGRLQRSFASLPRAAPNAKGARVGALCNEQIPYFVGSRLEKAQAVTQAGRRPGHAGTPNPGQEPGTRPCSSIGWPHATRGRSPPGDSWLCLRSCCCPLSDDTRRTP